MSYDYVFIHNPKTGGDTITALLNIKKTHRYIQRKSRKQNISFTNGLYKFNFYKFFINLLTSNNDLNIKPIEFSPITIGFFQNNTIG